MVSERRQLISLWIRASESIGQPMRNLSSNYEQNWQYQGTQPRFSELK
jgi:hypothetical protein